MVAANPRTGGKSTRGIVMMTAIDSSVLLAIFNAESDGPRWLEALIQARREGRLIICENDLRLLV